MKKILLFGLALFWPGLQIIKAENLPDGKLPMIQITKNGVYKLTYNQLLGMGLSHPEQIRIFGQRGKMLEPFAVNPENATLQEIPVFLETGNDGVFNTSDYVLFYAEGPYSTYFDSELGLLRQKTNPYAIANNYYITQGENGLRINTQNAVELSENKTVNKGLQIFHHENEWQNVAQLGTEWYGEIVDSISNSLNLSTSFDNISSNKKVKGVIDFLVRNNQAGTIAITAGSSNYSIPYNAGYSEYTFGFAYKTQLDFTIPDKTALVTMTLQNANIQTKCWLNYLTLNAECDLVYSGTPLNIYDTSSIGTNQITLFEISSTSNLMVWNISNAMEPLALFTEASDNTVRFKATTKMLTPFIAFNPDDAFDVENFTSLNYKALNDFTAIDLLIITHPDLLEAANDLASYRTSNDKMLVRVVSVDDILHNYAAGKSDPSAIYNYVRQQYQTSGLSYVLLMGAPSYDFRNLENHNACFVPQWISENSLSQTASFARDDYFGLLNDSGFTGSIDVGIGRIPAKTLAEAQNYVEKIKNYESAKSFGSWKNQSFFIADDGDGSIHLNQSEVLSNKVMEKHFDLNLNKIYFADFEEQVDSVLNDSLYQYIYSYPEAERHITNSLSNGALLITYVGHGAPGIWAHERVFNTHNFTAIQNHNTLPFIYVSSCEFARTDNPALEQDGSDLLFFESGGAIGLFASNRVNYSGGNYELASHIFEHIYQKNLRLGDIIREAKNQTSGTTNKFTFALLADPTLKLAIPQLEVKTNTLNGHAPNEISDTLSNNGIISLQGEISNGAGILQNQFNGKVVVRLYNHGFTDTTRANPGIENTVPFNRQGSLIASQTVDVINGNFEVVFDFSQSKYTTDDLHGKVSYYAYSDTEDATGSFEGFIVNGFVNGNTNQEAMLHRVYPNPVKSYAIFEFAEAGAYQLLLTDITGKVVKTQKVVNTNRIAFLRNQLKAGIYFYQVTDNAGNQQSSKLIFN